MEWYGWDGCDYVWSVVCCGGFVFRGYCNACEGRWWKDVRWKVCLVGKRDGGSYWSRNGERMERVVTIICFFCEWRFPVSFFSYLSCWVLWRGERKKGRYEREVKGFYCWHWMDWKVEGCIVWKSELGWISMNSLWVSWKVRWSAWIGVEWRAGKKGSVDHSQWESVRYELETGRRMLVILNAGTSGNK